MSDESPESTLILPGQAPTDTLALAQMPPVVWLRNPKTGVINRFRHGLTPAQPLDNDTIERCLKDGHTRSSEAAAKAQAIELAKLQGRPLPPWAEEHARAEPVATPAAKSAAKG